MRKGYKSRRDKGFGSTAPKRGEDVYARESWLQSLPKEIRSKLNRRDKDRK